MEGYLLKQQLSASSRIVINVDSSIPDEKQCDSEATASILQQSHSVSDSVTVFEN